MCYISMCSGCSWPICIAPHKYKAPLSFSRKQETLWLQQANQLILCLCECKWDNSAELSSSVVSAKLETDRQEGRYRRKPNCCDSVHYSHFSSAHTEMTWDRCRKKAFQQLHCSPCRTHIRLQVEGWKAAPTGCTGELLQILMLRPTAHRISPSLFLAKLMGSFHHSHYQSSHLCQTLLLKFTAETTGRLPLWVTAGQNRCLLRFQSRYTCRIILDHKRTHSKFRHGSKREMKSSFLERVWITLTVSEHTSPNGGNTRVTFQN